MSSGGQDFFNRLVLCYCAKHCEFLGSTESSHHRQASRAFDHINNIFGITSDDTFDFSLFTRVGVTVKMAFRSKITLCTMCAAVIAIRNRQEKMCGFFLWLVSSDNKDTYIRRTLVNKTWRLLKNIFKFGV